MGFFFTADPVYGTGALFSFRYAVNPTKRQNTPDSFSDFFKPPISFTPKTTISLDWSHRLIIMVNLDMWDIFRMG